MSRKHPSPAHAARLRSTAGQGTVEYVALVLLVAGVLASAVAFGGTGFKDGKLTKTIVSQIEESIAKVSGGR